MMASGNFKALSRLLPNALVTGSSGAASPNANEMDAFAAFLRTGRTTCAKMESGKAKAAPRRLLDRLQLQLSQPPARRKRATSHQADFVLKMGSIATIRMCHTPVTTRESGDRSST